jgi:hypothetical protein
MTRKLVPIAVFCAGILVFGSTPAPASGQTEVEKTVSIERKRLTRDETWMLRSGTSGHDLYQEFCASCHGTTAHGDGVAAELLSIAPTDLTRLASTRAGGEFPSKRVIYMVAMSPCDDPHHRAPDGTETMPCWKSILREALRSDGASHHLAYRLARYLESVQE